MMYKLLLFLLLMQQGAMSQNAFKLFIHDEQSKRLYLSLVNKHFTSRLGGGLGYNRREPFYTGSSVNPHFAEIYTPTDGFIFNGGVKVRL